MLNELDERQIIEEISTIKAEMGEELLILSHHYQRKSIVDLGDYCGDSFGLSQKAAASSLSRFIVFCGVHFMAESAAILSRPNQTVHIPAMEAGCWMADTVDIDVVKRAWDGILSVSGNETIAPIVYMNSDAALKDFCGRRGGAVCTSSNAPELFKWALHKADKVFFFPDQHLGRNTANRMGIPRDRIVVWNPNEPLGGNNPEEVQRASIILWDGYCLVHTRFSVNHMVAMRKRFPNAKIVVHPECPEAVVEAADAVGSTSFIVKYVESAPSESTIIIGTEVNLVNRLAYEHPDKHIYELYYSLCPNMFKITPKNLLECLKGLGTKNVVTVPNVLKEGARLALDRMLAAGSKRFNNLETHSKI